MILLFFFNCLNIFDNWSLSLWVVIYINLATNDLSYDLKIFSF